MRKRPSQIKHVALQATISTYPTSTLFQVSATMDKVVHVRGQLNNAVSTSKYVCLLVSLIWEKTSVAACLIEMKTRQGIQDIPDKVST